MELSEAKEQIAKKYNFNSWADYTSFWFNTKVSPINKQNAWNEVYELVISSKDKEIAKLQDFKDYVHKRLDDAGVEVDPESPHKESGCRIGGRLDLVFKEIAELKEKSDKFEKECVNHMQEYIMLGLRFKGKEMELSILRNRESKLVKTITALENQITGDGKQIQSLQEEIQQITKKHKERLADEIRDKHVYSERVKDRDFKINELREEMKKKEEEIQTLKQSK